MPPHNAGLLNIPYRWHIDEKALLPWRVPKRYLCNFEILNYLLLIHDVEILVVAAHAQGEELVKCPVDKGRAAKVARASRTFGDREGLDGANIVGDEVDGAAAGITDNDTVAYLLQLTGIVRPILGFKAL